MFEGVDELLSMDRDFSRFSEPSRSQSTCMLEDLVAEKLTSSKSPTASPRAFATSRDLEKWLKQNHKTETELWVRIYKKGSGTPSVTWNDCVIACLTWGWIDGHKRALDEASFLQRITPRRAKSNWSKKNCEHAERLIAEGLMQPSGLAHVEAARKDGRWDNAYAGSAGMVIPEDFLEALRKTPAAERFYKTLDRRKATHGRDGCANGRSRRDLDRGALAVVSACAVFARSTAPRTHAPTFRIERSGLARV